MDACYVRDEAATSEGPYTDCNGAESKRGIAFASQASVTWLTAQIQQLEGLTLTVRNPMRSLDLVDSINLTATTLPKLVAILLGIRVSSTNQSMLGHARSSNRLAASRGSPCDDAPTG
jgi:hypothetical protein